MQAGRSWRWLRDGAIAIYGIQRRLVVSCLLGLLALVGCGSDPAKRIEPASDGGPEAAVAGGDGAPVLGGNPADHAGETSVIDGAAMTDGGSFAACGTYGWGASPFAALSPDGAVLAIGSVVAGFKVLRWADAHELPISNIIGASAAAQRRDGGGSAITAIAFSADETTVAMGDDNGVRDPDG